MSLSHSRPPGRAPLVLFPALLGLLFCLFSVGGIEPLCLTAGCHIYAGYSLFGLPFYALGAAAFGLIFLLALGSFRSSGARRLLFWVLLAGLLIDTGFLIWQVLFWSCLSCLLVATLFGLAAAGAIPGASPAGRRLLVTFLGLWLVAYVPVVVATAKEILLPPWALVGPADAGIRVYFSPTCPACSETVGKILADPVVAKLTAFYPIAKDEEDGRRLAALLAQGEVGLTELPELFNTARPETGAPSWGLRVQLARNKMALARMGVATIPLVLSSDVIEVSPPSTETGNIPPWLHPDAAELAPGPGCGVEQPEAACQ